MLISDHRELRNSHVKFMLWVVYERIAVTVRLRLRCFAIFESFFDVALVDLVNIRITAMTRSRSLLNQIG